MDIHRQPGNPAGTYETFAAIADKLFGGSLAGTLTITSGLGGMGGAQPLAVTMNGGVAICADVDPVSVGRRIDTRYLDVVAYEHRRRHPPGPRRAQAERMAPIHRAVEANAVDFRRPSSTITKPVDIVTDQTSAHDPMMYVPVGVGGRRRPRNWGGTPNLHKGARESMAGT